MRIFNWLMISVILLKTGTLGADNAVLSNKTLQLSLDVTSDGIAAIQEVTWTTCNEPVFTAVDKRLGLEAWWPKALLPEQGSKPMGWNICETEHFYSAQAHQDLVDRLQMTCVVELAKEGSLFRMYVRLANRGNSAKVVEWFPGWRARWQPADKPKWIRWWKSLSFSRTEAEFEVGKKISLHSSLHSSNDVQNGVNPYRIGSNIARRRDEWSWNIVVPPPRQRGLFSSW